MKIFTFQMPVDRGNCAILAFMAQVNNIPIDMRAIHIRRWMAVYLLENYVELNVRQ